MNTRVRCRAAKLAGTARPERAEGMFRGRGMPTRITAISCAAFLTGAGLLLVAGCSGSGNSTASGSSASSGFGAAKSAPREPGALAVPQAADQAARLQASQSIIYTASLNVAVKDAARAAADAVSYASAAGGYTAAEKALTNRSAGQRPTVSLTLKIPVAGYPAALRRLSGLGRQTLLSQQSTDVTQEVADVDSRVTSQRDAIAQLRTLLRRAGSVTGLLRVQEQISRDESALESLLAQQRALGHETTYATISVHLVGPQPQPAAHQAARHGFATGLATGWRGFRHAIAWVLTALGVVLPFVIAFVILAGLGYAGWRWVTRRRARPSEAG